jgi:hypothetical protein
MPRTITEVETFTREQLEDYLKQLVKVRLNGSWLHKISEQHVWWKPDGSVVVTTTHTPEED